MQRRTFVFLRYTATLLLTVSGFLVLGQCRCFSRLREHDSSSTSTHNRDDPLDVFKVSHGSVFGNTEASSSYYLTPSLRLWKVSSQALGTSAFREYMAGLFWQHLLTVSKEQSAVLKSCLPDISYQGKHNLPYTPIFVRSLKLTFDIYFEENFLELLLLCVCVFVGGGFETEFPCVTDLAILELDL